MKVIDLFCGCGGMSLGFEKKGFKILNAYDNWEAAVEIYNNNFIKHKAIQRDLGGEEKLTIKEIKKFNPDMIIGGPPCQDFSSAGKRDEDMGRGDLTITFAKIVTKSKVKWFVMENVERITKTQKYLDVQKMFRKAGYGLSSMILDASLCGVPQIRKRFFMVGCLEAPDDFLSYYLNKNLAKEQLTMREYFGKSLKTEYYYRHPRNYSRRGIYGIDEPSPTIRGVNRPIPKGYPGHHLDATKDLSLVRPLTTIERSYIQTFPKDFIFKGSKTILEQMIGNAVPVKLAEYVASCINEYQKDIIKKGINTQITKIESTGQYAFL